MRKLGDDEYLPKHYNQIYELANSWWTKISNFQVKREDCYKLIDRRLASVWVDDDNNIVGYIAYDISPHPFNSDKTLLSIYSIVVKEEYKGSMLFFRMIKDVFKGNKAEEMSIIDTNENPMPYLTKLGFENIGNTWIRRI